MVDLIDSIICGTCGIGIECSRKNTEEMRMCEFYVAENKWIGKGIKEWLSSFDTSSATKCFEAVNLLKQRLEGGGRTWVL